jgi:hypothetical protein
MTKYPPEEAFVAIPLDDKFSIIKLEQLEQPLLPKHHHEKPVKQKTRNNPSHMKALALVTGSIMALLSQYLLSLAMWSDDVLQKTTFEVVLFSLAWSFWTCLMVFSAMLLVIHVMVDKNVDNGKSSNDKNKKKVETAEDDDDNDEDNVIFQMEAHYVVGALLAISTAWLLNDLFQVQTVATATHNALQIHPVLTVATAAAAYGLFLKWILSQDAFNSEVVNALNKGHHTEEASSSRNMMTGTFQMVASTLGVIIGVCSQFVLSMLLWRDHMTKPILSSVVAFSLLWSVLTVALTFSGCLSLRFLIDGTDPHHAPRTLLRMEASYVSSSLIGICLAWILIDVLTGMTEQILPSLFMLGVSLLTFRGILYCFPEEQCLARHQDEATTISTVDTV